jgi:tRNA/rRNA methyltransferase
MVVSIPGEPDYHSLNLAQAVQVMAWEMRRAVTAGASIAPMVAAEPDAGVPATHAQREAFLEHLEQALVAVGFLDPATPRKLMPRMRRLFARADLRAEEVDLLRGVCKQMLLAARGELPGRRPPDP